MMHSALLSTTRRLRLLLGFLAALTLTGCDAFFGPAGPETPDRHPGQPIGLVEITLSAEPEAGAPAAGKTLAPRAVFDLNAVPDGLQMEHLSHGSFTDGGRGTGGCRYLWATFKIRNAHPGTKVASTLRRKNVTFLAVSTARTIGQTAVSRLDRFDDTPAAPSIAPQVMPTGAVTRGADGRVEALFADALQVYTEDEVALISRPSVVTSIFPYGFVVRNPSRPADRVLAAGAGPDQFDGLVTFVIKMPWQATAAEDPYFVTMLFLAVEDARTRITQSLEEQSAAGTRSVEQRADALHTSMMTLLPYGAAHSETVPSRVVCSVRTAGPSGAPLATMPMPAGAGVWLLPGPSRSGPLFLETSTDFHAAACLDFAAVDDAHFVVQGFQSGKRFLGGGYTGAGTQIASTPHAAFFPGEEIEVSLTWGSMTGRYRVRSAPALARFAALAPVSTGDYPGSIALGDVDGDGDLDLAALNFQSHSVRVLLGNGAGGFTPAPGLPLPTQSDPNSLVMADVDGDGRLDLAWTDVAAGNVTVQLGDGTGGFSAAPGSPFSTGGSAPEGIAPGDVNGDGRLDLITANAGSNTVSVLLGDGSGGFSAASGSPVAVGAEQPVAVALGDLNGDGRLDLVTANRLGSTASVLLGDGDGGFAPACSPIALGTTATSIALGDVNGDGRLDLAAASQGTNDATVLLGDGTGHFVPSPGSPFVAGDGAYRVRLADVNGDGRLDLVTANADADDVSVLLGNGAGGFSPAPGSPFAVDDYPLDVEVGDVNGDGKPDLVTANANADDVWILQND